MKKFSRAILTLSFVSASCFAESTFDMAWKNFQSTIVIPVVQPTMPVVRLRGCALVRKESLTLIVRRISEFERTGSPGRGLVWRRYMGGLNWECYILLRDRILGRSPINGF